MNKVEIIVGLDNIVDYSENFDMEKEELYEILSMVKKSNHIITIIKTKDGKTVFFSTFNTDTTEDKQFILFIHEEPKEILKYLQMKYVETILNFEDSEEDVKKNANTILILAKAFVQLSGITVEEIMLNDEDIN